MRLSILYLSFVMRIKSNRRTAYTFEAEKSFNRINSIHNIKDQPPQISPEPPGSSHLYGVHPHETAILVSVLQQSNVFVSPASGSNTPSPSPTFISPEKFYGCAADPGIVADNIASKVSTAPRTPAAYVSSRPTLNVRFPIGTFCCAVVFSM